MTEFTSLPVIDLSPLIEHPSSQAADAVVQSIGKACREVGFFYVTGHGVSQELQDRMQKLAAEFFAQPEVSDFSVHRQATAYTTMPSCGTTV